ncbi:DUF885 domain-containing protein [Kribbella sp. NPDC050281]|uniref:DUF885 domain-containing protein n=1 Tax=Kribbella sp. NPDC050281 TaxID=3155515 RepID=UPI0034070ECC
MSSEQRPATVVDQVMDRFVVDFVALDPIAATGAGITGHETGLPDLSPDGRAEVSALRSRTLTALAAAVPVDSVDRVTVAAAREHLEVAGLLREAGAEESRLNNIDSPVQTVREVFDLMATSTVDDWATVATRLRQVPGAIEGYIASLRFAAARGDVSPRRQVLAAIDQSRANIGSGGFFATFAKDAAPADGDLPRSVRAELDSAARQAADAYDTLVSFLTGELLAQAPTADPVGPDRYALFARAYLGTPVDLEDAYAWGLGELSRINEQLRQTAQQIGSGLSIAEAMDHLTHDPARRLTGTDALRAWMQDKADGAIAALAGTHFDIPEPIRTIECRIAPTGGGTIYYTSPSDDFTRPGRMWWPVPPGVEEFSTWKEVSTVYHEGVPGHHLQIGQTVFRRDSLNRWRRLLAWVDGHGEGWALYAEQLMAELGFLEDPGDLVGMLSSQSFRAVRVVIDIGMHCGFEAPPEVGGGQWTYEKALHLLEVHSSKAESRRRYEIDRYLGIPGQAASYKLGERAWLLLRDEVRAREGSGFELKSFHRRALDLGSVGLDVLRSAVLGEFEGGSR